MEWIVQIARLLLVLVFALAAISKLADRRLWRRALTDFGIPERFVKPTAATLPVIELAIAAALLSNSSVRWGAMAENQSTRFGMDDLARQLVESLPQNLRLLGPSPTQEMLPEQVRAKNSTGFTTGKSLRRGRSDAPWWS